MSIPVDDVLSPLDDIADALDEMADKAFASPELLDKKTSPPSLTLYLKMDLQAGGGAAPMTGVFLPQNYRATPVVDLILYVHGNKVKRMGMDSTWTIDTMWSHNAYRLREWLNESGKQWVLVAPTLGVVDQYGDLAKYGSHHLIRIMSALFKYGPHKSLGARPRVGSIILAGHSGGGNPMLALANSLGTLIGNIKEIWGFDTMYGPVEDQWSSWAKRHSNVKLVFYYKDTARRSLTVRDKTAGLGNVIVVEGGAGHDYLQQRHWKERLDNIGASVHSDIARHKQIVQPPRHAGRTVPRPAALPFRRTR
jgi:hypothetical protein